MSYGTIGRVEQQYTVLEPSHVYPVDKRIRLDLIGAQFRKEFTLEEVLNSRMICDPLTLYQCCPTTDGGAAAVLFQPRAWGTKSPGSERQPGS